ncbi:hypothetical protein SAMN05421759_10332 [Roseivivax lentus]|uniref:Uncharacterized protein n=1 Tax=Roseivivax lentus TaxID=633194 RepID=A0A1N7LPC4_9RHOB|nr:hypothetical protein SAMN05421759_10332 [Roseivivax lentus]
MNVDRDIAAPDVKAVILARGGAPGLILRKQNGARGRGRPARPLRLIAVKMPGGAVS